MFVPELYFGDLGILAASAVTQAITKMSVSYTLDSVSQLTLEIWDEGGRFNDNNYFLIRRDIRYKDTFYEVAKVDLSQGESESLIVQIEARNKACQLMKRDKNPEAYGGISATDYAAIVAERYNLRFVGQPTSTKRVISKNSTDSADTSVWDVLKQLAGEAQFVIFESDNTLYFASEEWLLGRWANIDLTPPGIFGNPNFPLTQFPNCTKSDDDPYQAEFRALILRENAVNLRAGMTVNLNFVNGFNGKYLITEVAYEVNSPDPVSVSCRTAQKPEERSSNG